MKQQLPGIIESVLFAAGDAVDMQRLAEIAQADLDSVKEAVAFLISDYAANKRGFSLIEIDGAYQICTRPEYYPYVQAIAGARRQQGLSEAALEVLSIIAYNQPVTKNTVEHVRGVNSDWAVTKLAERGLVEEKGRLDAPGKPILYVTTQEFLRCFGLISLNDLPDFDADVVLEQQDPAQMQIDI